MVASPAAAAESVIEDGPGVYRGVEAVVDKDFASGFLAAHLGVPVFVVSTGGEVAIRFRKPDQRFLDRMTLGEARSYLEAGEFPEGSMGPKVRAAVEFIEHGGQRAIITSPDHLEDAIAGRTGTHVKSRNEHVGQPGSQRHADAGLGARYLTYVGRGPSCGRPRPCRRTGSGRSTTATPR